MAIRTIPSAVSSSSRPSDSASRADGGGRGLGVERDPAGEPRVAGQVAQQQVGVGHGRLVAAAPVTGGPRLGAGRARPDPQRAAAVAPADRAAAGADRVDVDHRQLDRAAVDLARVGPAHLALLDHADVAGGAAHVEPDRVALAADPGEQPGADGAAGRAGEDAPGAGRGRLSRRNDAAGGLHDHGCRQPRATGRLLEPSQIAAEQRREVGVDRGRRAALVLAEAGQDLVRGGDVDPGQPAAGARRSGARGWVPVGEEQADRDRLGAALAQRRRQARGLPGAERLDHPVGPDPLGGLEAQLALDEGAGFGAQSR